LYIPVIPALRRLRQKNHKFKLRQDYNSKFHASIGYIVRPYLKKLTKCYSVSSIYAAQFLRFPFFIET
jgi:hypothetical protein